MNKLREKLALPFDGLRTETLDELETVCRDVSVSFSLFCAENYQLVDFRLWESNDIPVRYTTEELFNKFLENYDK